MTISLQLPPPENWQDFEKLCRDLWSSVWGEAQRYGSSGEQQHGIDIYGRDPVRAVQCKLKSQLREARLKPEHIREEIAKTRGFPHPLSELIFATTAPRSTKDQNAMLAIDEEQAKAGAFRVRLYAWDDIIELLDQHPAVKARYYGHPSKPLQTPLPALPEQFVARPDVMKRIKAALFGANDPPKVGLRGMGGCGKTVIAATVAHDSEVRKRFSAGVVWITVGEQADILSLLGLLARLLTDAPPPFADESTGRQVVASLLTGRNVLLVLDDVWTKEQARALDVAGPGMGLIVTTRNQAVVERLNATSCRVSPLSDKQASRLLAHWAGRQGKVSPAIAAAIAGACGNLPLALAMAGALARQPARTWADALEMLRDADLAGLESDFPNYPHPTMLAAIDVGVRDLPPDERERYLDLAAFGRQWVPVATLRTLWGEKAGRTLVSRFVSRSLATLDDSETQLHVHDLQADYLRVRAGDLVPVHRRLIEAYRRHVKEGDFANADRMIDDGYFFQQLPRHLDAAGLTDELNRLLFDCRWMFAKLAATDVNALIGDYAFLSTGGAGLIVRKALRLAASTLARDPDQLANQLLSRLQTKYPEVERLLAGARAWGVGKTWLRPTRPALIPAGGCLQQTFMGNTGGVRRLRLLGGGLVEAYCGDGIVRTWDIESAAVVKTARYEQPDESDETLENLHEAQDAASPYKIWTRLDERRVVGLAPRRGNSGTVCIHVRDINTATLEKEFDGECPVSHSVRAIVALDEQRIVTGASEYSICVWDLTDRKLVRMFEAHKAPVTELVRLDEHRFASGSADETVCIWDLSPQALAAASSRHEHSVMAVAATRRGVVSSSFDDRVLLWPLEGEDPPRVLVAADAGWVRPLVAFDENLIAGCSVGGILRIWELDPPCLLHELDIDAHTVQRLGERRFVDGTPYGAVRVWDLESGLLLDRLLGHTDRVNSVEVIGTRFLASGSVDQSIRIWDVDAGEEVRVLHEDAYSWITVVDDRFVVFESKKGKLRAWDWTIGESFELWPLPVKTFSLKPNGYRLSCITYEGLLLVFDLRKRTCVTSIGADVHNFKDNELLWLDAEHVVTGSDDHSVRVWNLESGKCVAVSFADGPIKTLSVIPELKIIVAGDGTGSVQVLAFEQH